MSSRFTAPVLPDMGRRRFVRGLAMGGVAAGLGLWLPPAARAAALGVTPRRELSGTEFDLSIGEHAVDFTGKRRIATVVNGQLPAPLLRWRQGDTITLRVRNTMRVPSSIHWHGIILPSDMDGVPGLSFKGIPPGGSYTYRFTVHQRGTYWYHSHTHFQEQTGLYGPIVVEPREGERFPADRQYVVMLSDWSDESPEHIYAILKKHSDFYNFGQLTVGDFAEEARAKGLSGALKARGMWDRMRMAPTDLADVSGYTYTYLMNGHAPAANWTGLFRRGEKVRLRFINGSAMSFFDVRIPGLKMTVVATDGQDVEPVTIDEFRIGVAETYDVIVEPADDRAYAIFAQSMDRSGYACGTLAPREGMHAELPPMDPRPRLTMTDMMGSMAGMKGMAMDKPMHGSGTQEMKGMSGMQGMSSMQGMSGMDGHDGHAMAMPGQAVADDVAGGPGVAMRVATPRTNLDDPGAGLRHNGRRVLTYADLHTIGGPVDAREPGREVRLHLTGNMDRYMWSFNGRKFSDAEPLRFRHGEQLRVTLINDTMMTHPIHLHGMWSELESPDHRFQVRKHTISVQPAQQVSYRVSADALGHWAYHCHLLYHMEAGMFREVVVA